jgi:PAS domain S-box-containing protein
MKAYDVDAPVSQASLHHLAAMLQSAVDAIISIDAVGAIESVNPATEKLFGYDAAELVGQDVKMPEPYRNQHDNYVRQHRETGQRKIIGIGREVMGQRKDGSTFPRMHVWHRSVKPEQRGCAPARWHRW